jgi:hypothetical protein
MIAIYALVFRILAGERYVPASKGDTKVWLALLAAVPPEMGVTYTWAKLSHDWPLFWIWLSVTGVACCLLVLWFLITKLPGIKSVGSLALLGWLAAFGTAFYINR